MKVMQRVCPVLLAGFAGLAVAQTLPPGSTVSSASLTALGQFDTDLDSGGNFGWYGAYATGSVLRQFTPQFAAGITLRYDYEQWRFGNPTAFGGQAPWSNVNRPQVGASAVFSPADGWRIVLAPSVEWAYENGADTADATIYGAVAIASRTFSPSLTLGIGAAVYRQLYETKAFPFLAIDWKIDDRWRLSNPLPAGPGGGAGLELSYKVSDAWETGFGGAYRSYRFRLDQAGPTPDGIGEQRMIPLFLRISRLLDRQSRLDFYAAALVNGRLSVKNPEGNDISSEDYATAPVLGVTFQHRF